MSVALGRIHICFRFHKYKKSAEENDSTDSTSKRPIKKAATEKRVDVEKRNLFFLQTLQTL